MMGGKIELLNMDCMDYLRGCADLAFDLAVVDPPYGINVRLNIGRRGEQKPSDYKPFAGGDKQAPSKHYFNELKRVSKYQVIWGANNFIESMPDQNSKCWLVWDKNISDKVNFSGFEMAWTNLPGLNSKIFKKARTSERRHHPTQKPVELYAWILSHAAKKNDRILDTHLGSGTAAIAAYYAGCDFVGIELSDYYFDLAEALISEATKQEVLL